MLQVKHKEIRQSQITRMFALMILSGAFCLLTVVNAFAQVTADLEITKTASSSTVTAGSNITYSIAVSNNGPNATTNNAGFIDNIPANTTFVSFTQIEGMDFNCTPPAAGAGPPAQLICRGGSLSPNITANSTLVVKVNPGTPVGTVITNTVTTGAAFTIDPDNTNNTATVTTTVVAPPATAATVSVSGRVTTASGGAIMNVRLSLTDSQGNVRAVTTDSSGHYRFDDVQAGETYILTAIGKRYSFSQPVQVLNINEETNQVNFVANSEKRLRVF